MYTWPFWETHTSFSVLLSRLSPLLSVYGISLHWLSKVSQLEDPGWLNRSNTSRPTPLTWHLTDIVQKGSSSLAQIYEYCKRQTNSTYKNPKCKLICLCSRKGRRSEHARVLFAANFLCRYRLKTNTNRIQDVLEECFYRLLSVACRDHISTLTEYKMVS